MRLDFVIVGAQKAGTTSLAAALAATPGVFVPRAEQPSFETPYFESGAVDALRYLMSHCDGDAWRGIKRPNYLGLEVIPPRLAAAFPECYVLVVVRDPVARAVSAWNHYVEYSHVPFLPPGEGLARLLEGENLKAPRAYEVLYWGRYRELLLRYLRVFPRERVIVIGPDELADDPLKQLRGLDGFPEAPVRAVPAKENVGSQSVLNMRLRRAMLRQLVVKDPATGTLVARTRNPARLGMAEGFRRLAGVVRHWEPRGRHPAEVEPEVLYRLANYYEPDVNFLREEFGVDLANREWGVR